jgi:FkbM family methyltransferase
MPFKRYLLFARRIFRGSRFGFAFRGTTRTPYPDCLRFGDKWVRIVRHGHQTEFHDLVDVLLDDSYGLGRIKHANTIVDIGANIGLFSGFARLRFPNATIQAYEPDPDTFRMAEQNLAGLATIYNSGVWATDGVARVQTRGSSPLTNQVIPDEGGNVSLVSFRTVLDRAGGTIDLLKVDCEGAEWTFMKDPDLFRAVRAVRMEYHLVQGVQTVWHVQDLAIRLGYEITRFEKNGPCHGILWLDRPGL